jgi:hypothetical protein
MRKKEPRIEGRIKNAEKGMAVKKQMAEYRNEFGFRKGK